MGHAGAIISGGKGSGQGKVAAFEENGIAVSPTPADMATTLMKIWQPAQ
jgi:succinyl-CoA synthetase alpha subunit